MILAPVFALVASFLLLGLFGLILMIQEHFSYQK